MSVNFASLPNLKISCDSSHQSTEIRFIEDDDQSDIFPYRCICKSDPCECGCSDISEGDIERVFDSLGIKSREEALTEGVRLNTLHVWGTAELSSDDLLGFFAEYNPSTIEWINDDTCNVVFEKESSGFRALQNLSEPRLVEETIAVSSEDDSDNDTDRAVERILSLAGEMPIDYDDAEGEEDGAIMETMVTTQKKPKTRTSKNSLPVGKWRQAIGIPEKAEMLFVRYANAGDRKRFGAERESRYYQRYGNPNFGGVTGIITESYRRRMRQNQRRTSPLGENTRDVQIDGRTPVSYGELYPDTDSADGKDQNSEEETPNTRPTARTMRMIADEEEERRKTKTQSAVHARLGGRHKRLKTSEVPRRSQRDPDDFDVDLRVMLSRRDRSPLSDSDYEDSRSWQRERRRKPRRRSRSREERPRKSRLDGRLGPTNDELNPGSDFMRRRKDFYHHDDRNDTRTKGRSRDRPRIDDRWVNDKFGELD